MKPYEEPKFKKRLRERPSDEFGVDSYYDEEDDYPPIDVWEEELFEIVRPNFAKRYRSTRASVK